MLVFTVSQVVFILLMSLATASVSLTITRSKLFEPIRVVLKENTPLLGELASCPYCMSHWISFLFFVPAFYSVYDMFPFALYIIIGFAVVSLASLVMALVFHSVSLISE